MIKVIGAGLAGCEAAYFLAEAGHEVQLYDIKPSRFTPAHSDKNFGELVCSNSLKGNDPFTNACGLLKQEMRELGSIIIEAADATRVPAGGALAVDRALFARYITHKIRSHGNIKVVCEEVKELPSDEWCIVATGPLTCDALACDIKAKLGGDLHFYDASAPIVARDSIDMSRAFFGDRYGRGGDDYINCPMTKEEYELFVRELTGAERAVLHDFERGEILKAACRWRLWRRAANRRCASARSNPSDCATVRATSITPSCSCAKKMPKVRLTTSSAADKLKVPRTKAGVFAHSRAQKRSVSALRRNAPQHLYQLARSFKRRLFV